MRPTPPERFIEPRQSRGGLAWLSVVVALAGHASVTGALITERIDPVVGVAVVVGSTVCSILLIAAEALQRRTHAEQMSGEEQ
ncbi:MAG: hypothetical protein WBM50_15400 [Acidimicrobiales bacterium]